MNEREWKKKWANKCRQCVMSCVLASDTLSMQTTCRNHTVRIRKEIVFTLMYGFNTRTTTFIAATQKNHLHLWQNMSKHIYTLWKYIQNCLANTIIQQTAQLIVVLSAHYAAVSDNWRRNFADICLRLRKCWQLASKITTFSTNSSFSVNRKKIQKINFQMKIEIIWLPRAISVAVSSPRVFELSVYFGCRNCVQW